MTVLDPYIEAWELRELTVNHEVRPRAVAQFFLARIEELKLNPKLGAFMTVAVGRAMEDAVRLESGVRGRGASSFLCVRPDDHAWVVESGITKTVPFGDEIKDALCAEGNSLTIQKLLQSQRSHLWPVFCWVHFVASIVAWVIHQEVQTDSGAFRRT